MSLHASPAAGPVTSTPGRQPGGLRPLGTHQRPFSRASRPSPLPPTPVMLAVALHCGHRKITLIGIQAL